MERERKVGLALGAGAARGLAHIGVLKALEENGIRVDCIAGTSIGAVIGSLYASGYSPAQIEDMVRSIDWREIFSRSPERPLVPLVHRFDLIPPLVRVGLDLWKLRLPQAIDSDYRINRFLTKHLAGPGLKAERDFDRLPIPFRAVAADLRTAERVVLSKGSLDRAVRASMSTPVQLVPVRQGERLLVDGGIADHLPVGVVREMGAEVVIAVNVRIPPLPPQKYENAVGMAVQVVDVLARARNETYAQAADVTITPDLLGIVYSDYKKFEEIIALGYQAAMAEMGEIQEHLAPDPGRSGSPAALGNSPSPGDSSISLAEVAGAAIEGKIIRAIRVEENRCVREERILDIFEQRPGHAFNLALALRGMDALHATRLFESTWLDFESAGPTDLAVIVHVREAWRQTFELGAAYNEADRVSGFVRLGNRNLFGGGESLHLTARASDSELGVRGQLSGDRLFGLVVGYFGEAAVAEEKPRFFRDGESPGRAEFDRQELTLGLQRSMRPAMLLRVGGTIGRVKTRFRQAVGFPEASDRIATLHTLVVWDDLDDRFFPAHGRAFSLSAERSLPGEASRDYWQLLARGRYAVSISKRNILEAQFLGAGSQRDTPVYELPRLGGPDLLPGYHRDELWGRHVVAGGISHSFLIMGRLRLKAMAGAGNVWENRSQVSFGSMKGGFGLALGHPTRFGPLSVGWGRSNSRPPELYLTAGFD